MSASLAKLYIDFASRGIGNVKADMAALQQEMAASQSRAAALQSRLAKLSPKSQKTEREEILKQILVEETHQRTIQQLQKATGLKDQQKALENLDKSIQNTEKQAAKLRDELKELDKSSGEKKTRLTQINKKEQKTMISKKEINERQDILRSMKQEKHERQEKTKKLHETEVRLKNTKQLQKDMTSSLKGQEKGIQAFSDKIGKVKGIVSGIAGAFQTVGVAASAAAAAGLGGMLALARAADPTGWRMFQAEVEILSIHIGRIFIPVLRQLTRIVQSVADWFRNLTPAQRQQIRMFAMIGVAILAVIGVIGSLGTALMGLIPVVISVAAAINAALSVSTGGFWAFVPIIGALVTGLLGLMGVAVGAGGAFYVLGQQGESFGDKLKNAWNQIWAVVGPIVDKFIEGMKRIFAVAQVYFGMVGEIIGEFLDSFNTNWTEVWQTAQAAFSQFMEWVIEGFKVIGAAGMGLWEIMRQVAMAIKDAITNVVAIIQTLASNTTRLLNAMGQFDPKHPIESARRIADAVKQNYQDMANTLGNQKNPFANFDMNKVKQKVEDFYVKATVAEQKAKDDHQKGKMEANPDEVPMAQAKAPQLRDVAEVWKAAQTAQQNDPMLKVQQERLELQRQALEEQRKQTEALNEIKRRREGLR